MNKGISPVGVNFSSRKVNKSAGKVVKNSIDRYYEKELKAIRERKAERDTFVKLDPGHAMESTKNRIQILIENMKMKKD